MRRPSSRNLIAFCLLTLVSLLGTGCASSSDSSTAENTTTTSIETITLQPEYAPIAIAAGYYHSCALHQTGIISCWGSNYSGQLGNGSKEDFFEPVKVADITDATAITAGREHSCALHQDGTISCWGHNEYGQLGDGQSGQNNKSSVPVQVADITDATAITTGGAHSCALHQDGTISCWGHNEYGQLGDGQSGQNNKSSVPVQVADITDATAITTGSLYSCALRQDGTISCWGDNEYGQLGDGQSGQNNESSVPVQVAGITDATAITTGGAHSCALHQDGIISCWGHNEYGQLGNGNDAHSFVPAQVTDIADATAITAGNSHSCALHAGGSISCWGNNLSGRLGNGTDADASTPQQVDEITDATAITAGYIHSCTLHQTGTISCWGNNSYGQLGNGMEDNFFGPGKVVGITNATAITAGGHHSCALHQDSAISCWGRNRGGQLGNGNKISSSIPVKVESITDATAVTTGYAYSCALHQDGTISCWGGNYFGQLGNGQSGQNNESSVPAQVAGITDATAITTSRNHSCALHQDGTISCWGNNEYGQLGNGESGYVNTSLTPVQVANITDATAITAGREHSCALHQDGTISCWGYNLFGQLGNGSDIDSSVPKQVADITDATAITTGGDHSCALHEDGTISCWGRNSDDQLGNGGGRSYVPVQVANVTDSTAITAGDSHSCTLYQDGTISCWGDNTSGQLGNPKSRYNFRSFSPLQDVSNTDATSVTTGNGHSCALHQDGTISCWGNNADGQLGNGIWLPQPVIGFGG